MRDRRIRMLLASCSTVLLAATGPSAAATKPARPPARFRLPDYGDCGLYVGTKRLFVIGLKSGEVLSVEDYRGDGKSFSATPTDYVNARLEPSNTVGWTSWIYWSEDQASSTVASDVMIDLSTARPGKVRFHYCIAFHD